MLEIVLLTLAVIITVLIFGIYLFFTRVSNDVEHHYIHPRKEGDDVEQQKTLKQKIDEYLAVGAVPFWAMFALDCLILVFSTLMAAYLVLGGQVLVPVFWKYVLLGVCSIPFFTLGMKLFRSYHAIAETSLMVNLARIVCALFVGVVCVEVLKHVLPQSLIPIYPIWKEQLVMMIVATIMMWGERVVVMYIYDASTTVERQLKAFVFGTTIPTIDAALSTRRDMKGAMMLTAFVQVDSKDPQVSTEGAVLLRGTDNIIEDMVRNEVDLLIVSLTAYPDFFTRYRALADEITSRGMRVIVAK